MEYIYMNKKINIMECDNGYVSPYSYFLIENYPLNFNISSYICDYGAGTGILGIIASLYNIKRITSIENNPRCFDLVINNYKNNNLYDGNLFYIDEEKCVEKFDSIICNPASLPMCISENSFCCGGELGLDMIFNVINFSKKHLSINGKLYIIVTSTPKS